MALVLKATLITVSAVIATSNRLMEPTLRHFVASHSGDPSSEILTIIQVGGSRSPYAYKNQNTQRCIAGMWHTRRRPAGTRSGRLGAALAF